MILNIAWLQSWEESEAGWGQRPDGYSLHLTEQAAKDYTRGYMDEQKRQLGPTTPHTYNRPAGKPYQVIINDQTLTELKKEGNLRLSELSNMPKLLIESQKSGWSPIEEK